MLKTEITQERWLEAQNGEILHHINESLESSYAHYGDIYEKYFNYLDITKDLNNKSIMEIGPARFAGLLYCNNYNKSYIVEPLTFEGVKPYYDGKNIEFINEIYEDCDSPTVDEIWFLNVLQHVKNPDHLIEKAKKHSKVIKFFEPINTEINNEHPFSFSEEDYKYYFGDSVKLYTPNDVNFHNAFCVYGIYKCEE
jgi:hypothetical protein